MWCSFRRQSSRGRPADTGGLGARRKRNSRTRKILLKKKKRNKVREPTSEARIHSPIRVALSIGGNLGESEHIFRRAISGLRRHLVDLEVASLYRTKAVSSIPQPDYLNTAVVARTNLGPEELLALLKAHERDAGRRRALRHGPRPLDLDLLIYGNRRIGRPEITVPHPSLRNRRFYLAPLAEIAAHLQIPPDGSTVAALLAAVRDHSQLQRLDWTIAP